MTAPEIETSRLLLRRFTSHDLDGLALLYSDPDVVRYLGEGKPLSKEETHPHLKNFIENYWESHGFGRWASIHKQDKKMIGYCGFRVFEGIPELVYTLAKTYWGKGLATEAAKACLRYGFEELQLDKIVAITRLENLASVRVMQRIGMKYEKQALIYGNECICYSISRADYQSEVLRTV